VLFVLEGSNGGKILLGSNRSEELFRAQQALIAVSPLIRTTICILIRKKAIKTAGAKVKIP